MSLSVKPNRLAATILTVALSSSVCGAVVPWDCNKGTSVAVRTQTHLTLDEAISLALAAAKKYGYDPATFKYSSACFSSVDQRWTIFLDDIRRRLGGDFIVWVRDGTGETKVMPGD